MGRGRAKAKQTKVARDLKYHTPNTDFGALQRELSSAPAPAYSPAQEVEEDDFDDPYADKYADEDEDEDDAAPASR